MQISPEPSQQKAPCIFFDRDGVVNQSPGAGYVESVDDFHIPPSFLDALRVVGACGYRAVVVTNQKCISTGIVSKETVESIHSELLRAVEQNGLDLLDIYYCPHGGDHPDRKPAPGMLLKAAEEHNLDLSRSWMVGDSERDVQAGRAAGCKTVLIKAGEIETCADFRLSHIDELPSFLEGHLSNTNTN